MKKSLLLVFVALMSVFSANAATINVNFSLTDWKNAVASQGWWQIYTPASENGNAISVSNISTTTAEMWKTYTMSELDEEFTYLEINGEEVNYSNVTATLSTDGSIITCVADFIAGDVTYHVTMVYDPAGPHPMDYDSNSDVDMTFELSDITYSEYDPDYEDVYFVATNANRQTIVLDINVDEEDADIAIPEGTYNVDEDYTKPHILIASPGVYENSLYPSYLGVRAASGGISSVWFIEEGSLVVKKVTEEGQKKLYMELTAKNSYGKTLHATVGHDTATGINTVVTEKTPLRKVARDNKIVILKGEKMFDAAGKTLK